jgi:hypothetical protein
VFDQFDSKYEVDIPIDKRSYGNLVQEALERGIMEWNGHAVVSRRKNCHKMLIRVYRSLLYTPTPQEVPMPDYSEFKSTSDIEVPESLVEPEASKSWWTKFKEKWFDEVY